MPSTIAWEQSPTPVRYPQLSASPGTTLKRHRRLDEEEEEEEVGSTTYPTVRARSNVDDVKKYRETTVISDTWSLNYALRISIVFIIFDAPLWRISTRKIENNFVTHYSNCILYSINHTVLYNLYIRFYNKIYTINTSYVYLVFVCMDTWQSSY